MVSTFYFFSVDDYRRRWSVSEVLIITITGVKLLLNEHQHCEKLPNKLCFEGVRLVDQLLVRRNACRIVGIFARSLGSSVLMVKKIHYFIVAWIFMNVRWVIYKIFSG